jgi:hypothetical protein
MNKRRVVFEITVDESVDVNLVMNAVIYGLTTKVRETTRTVLLENKRISEYEILDTD